MTTDGPPATASRVVAHAKINLLLRVLAREASGYHGIETIFQAIDLADTVTVRVDAGDRTLHCAGPGMPAAGLGAPETNLAFRAATAYAAAAGWPDAWHIDIEKHIPVGGGLGGGSTDAAAVLRAFETLAPQPLGRRRVVEIAGTLGADVSFFAAGVPLALGWGRGDRLLPLPALPPMAVTLIAFDEGVNTAMAYGALDELRRANHGESGTGAGVYPLDAFCSWPSIVGLAFNDFESVATRLHSGVARWLPAVHHAARRLSASGTPAVGMMSGSGATCFVLRPVGVPLELPGSPGMRVIETKTVARIAAPTFHYADD